MFCIFVLRFFFWKVLFSKTKTQAFSAELGTNIVPIECMTCSLSAAAFIALFGFLLPVAENGSLHLLTFCPIQVLAMFSLFALKTVYSFFWPEQRPWLRQSRHAFWRPHPRAQRVRVHPERCWPAGWVSQCSRHLPFLNGLLTLLRKKPGHLKFFSRWEEF